MHTSAHRIALPRWYNAPVGKPKSKRNASVSRGDLEALALVLFGTAFFLGVSVYPDPPLSGQVGAYLKAALWGNLGLLSWLFPIPFALAGTLILLKRPLRGLLRESLLTGLAGVSSLPLIAGVAPEWGGALGTWAHQALTTRLGPAGLLLAVLALSVVLDLALRHPPFTLVLTGFKRGIGAGLNLFRAYRAYRTARAQRARLRKAASSLAQEVQALLARYPDHRALATLQADLKAFLKNPDAFEPSELEGFRRLLDEFTEARAAELAERLAAENPGFSSRIQAWLGALNAPLSAHTPLMERLEERRKALILEFKAIQEKETRLARRAERAAEALRRSAAGLEAEWKAHEARLGEWRALEGLLEDLEARAESWTRWVEWAEQVGAERHAEALERLLEHGLEAAPPEAEEAAPPSPADPPAEATPPEPPVEEATAPPPSPNPAPRVSGGSGKTGSVSVHPTTTLSLPSPELLDPPEPKPANARDLQADAKQRAEIINETLSHFGLEARVVDWARGPTVTRFEVEPAPGEKISRIANLANDLARALAVGSVRVEAPIPGKSVIGLEVPNAERELVRFSEALHHPAFQRSRDKLPLILGKSIDGEMWVRDLAKMPHLLIAGSTGSGKSVCINTLLMSLLYRYLPTELRFLMIDPKMVELTPYDGIPHLVRGVVTNPADAAGVLLGAVAHMERRYKMMSQVGARNLEQFNAKMRELGEPTLPYLVIVIDELADLMITSPKEVEQAILRLAQMARATGMHLILATQRPSVDILTSLIKVNIPARIAFAVSSSHDSRTILDTTGAERLTGQGDMLFHQPGLAKPVRLQGPFLSDKEIHRITNYLRGQAFDDAFGEAYGADFDGPVQLGDPTGGKAGELDFSDPLLKKAAEIVVEEGQASVSRLQRRLSVGHARAGKLMDLLEAMGIVGPHQGSKPREVLITKEELPEYFGEP
ncbi:FtsK/SpoIIIE family DNA translocase [Marinithermus hydrothermalis]|uniref:Cell division protein FtsK/SpoIIIE n=1 Tax=Marinithermus hydrothermalis (strain DSM 14884 / JCM 11576 / T1) TaxID=869210 RepID=F2NLJ9_MARHT|nr:cell division protein FtsK/SpoIIIE [Marinithermus hydrothermalis DSM 14884]